MRNIVGRPLNQLVDNRANSSGERQTYRKKRLTINIIGHGSSPCSYGTGPAHRRVEKGQLIIVWRRASSSSCGEGPAHLENSNREDY